MSKEKQTKSVKPSKPKSKPRVKTDGEVRRAVVGRASAEARQIAAVILQVLAGELGTSEASVALGKSPAQYYKLEVRALEGLLQGCEPRPRGRQRNSDQELARLKASNDRLERECARLQSLVRLLGKTVPAKGKSKRRAGKPPSSKKEKATPKKGKTKRRKGKVRALRLAAQMIDHVDEQSPSGPTSGPVCESKPAPPARPRLPRDKGSESPQQAQSRVNGGT